MAVCFCPSHLISVLTPCSECIHAFISTLLPMFTQPPVDSYMETQVPLCCGVCLYTTMQRRWGRIALVSLQLKLKF